VLPFLKKKFVAAVQTLPTKSMGQALGGVEPEEESHEAAALKACAQDVLRAIEAKDADHLVQAMQSFIAVIDAEPKEGPESNDFDSMNAKAAEEQE
jgi:hypothetical protein